MKKTVFFLLVLLSQLVIAQDDYSKYKPVEPLYNNGDVTKFYEYLSMTIDFEKVKNEKDIIIAFVLDGAGKMNAIKVAFCAYKEAESTILAALQNAENWDMSNQRDRSLYVCYKMKLFFTENKVSGRSKAGWFTDKVEDIKLNRNEFDDQIYSVVDKNEVHSQNVVEVRPEYPGGIERFYKLIGANFRVPSDKNFVPGKVYVEFVIEKDGTVSDIKVRRHLGFGTDKEAIRVLNLSEKWKPAEQDGKKVRCRYSLPIAIMLPR